MAVARHGWRILAVTVETPSVTTAETVAIATATNDTHRKEIPAHVLTESQVACRAYLKGVLPATAAILLRKPLHLHPGIAWCPTHDCQEQNEAADSAYRAANNRVPDSTLGSPPTNVSPVTPREIIALQRSERGTLAPPQPKL